jgi:hypothetical protein
MVSSCSGKGMWVYHLFCSSSHLNSPFFLWFMLQITFGRGKRRPLSDATTLLASSISFESKNRGRTQGKFSICVVSFDETD